MCGYPPSEIQKSYPIPCIVVKVEYVEGLQGNNLLVIKEKDASVIGNLMIGTDENEIPDEVDELSLSALTEAMNVMMGPAATSMSEMFRYKIVSAPGVVPPNLPRRSIMLTVNACMLSSNSVSTF